MHYIEYEHKKSHAFIYGNNFKPLVQNIVFGRIIDNRKAEPTFVLEEHNREKMDNELITFFSSMCIL